MIARVIGTLQRVANAFFFTRGISRRFIEEWLKSASTILERLRLKTATVKLQIKRARLQLAQRKELGEILHVIDFEKLKIENQDFAKLLEAKNLYVIDMKKIAGD